MHNDSTPTSTEYETLQALLPAYGLGFTDPEETRLVETLLKKFPEAAAELADYETMAAALLYSVPQVSPPAHVLDKLLQAAAGAAAARPVPAGVAPLRRWMLPAFAAAVIALLVVGNMLFVWTVAELRQDQRDLADRVDAQAALLNLAAEDQLVRFELHDPDDETSAMNGYVLCNPDERVVLLRAQSFPPLAEDMAYQVWLWQDDQRIVGPVFTVDTQGNGTAVFRAPAAMRSYSYIGITPEKASGSREPTNPPVARGALYVNDGSALDSSRIPAFIRLGSQ